MRRELCFFTLVVWAALETGCAGSGAGGSGAEVQVSATPAPAVVTRDLGSLSLDELSAEWRRLRAIRGHFQGGEWNDEVDSSRSRKSAVMAELRTRLSAEPSLLAARVEQVFGPSDPVDGMLGYEVSDGNSVLIYSWRGGHDFLYFEVDPRGVVVRSDWWFAGE